MDAGNKQSDASTPRSDPSLLQQRTRAERERIWASIEELNGRQAAVVDRRTASLAEIERIRREVAELDVAVAACEAERADLWAMDDALGAEERALEIIVIGRAGR